MQLVSNKYVFIGALIVALGAFWSYDRYVSISRAEERVTAALNASYQAKLNEAFATAKDTEKKLRDQSFANEKAKDEEILALTGKLRDALGELRKRPQRSSTTDYTNPASNTPPCTGTSLFQEDGGFLVREAARADSVMSERNYYYKQYEDARKMLDAHANQK